MKNDGPMPWRLQIAAQFLAPFWGDLTQKELHDREIYDNALCSADRLIAAHLATVPTCEHLRERRAFTTEAIPLKPGEKIRFGARREERRRTWCLDCGEELKP